MAIQRRIDKNRPFQSKPKVNDILTVLEDSRLLLLTDLEWEIALD